MRTELKDTRKPGAWQREEFLITRKELDDVQQILRKNLRELKELLSYQQMLVEEINYALGKEALQKALETINTGLVEKTGRGVPGSAENTGSRGFWKTRGDGSSYKIQPQAFIKANLRPN